ncbi:Beta-barrel assembly machine subunit BamD [Maritimibacter alkaliphilus HTCC2654]|jgi:outer membrane protein assembly factor BamD|uniref:Outer membrane protein assembly factor BamD n=1 Tax=Maritimibacter alkaliphilus HTCC2654 TaxID=314271 RepID=A3VI08_9RHOB|nr:MULTISPECIES: outer membrane protein assembly factor BamD [Maritimibacter]EAQ12007.1 Putative ComL lipoprotein [Rhodobacterales bacterium HTCC2654] [Maritimibacter alkaliphilus HTCC2654]MBL6426283.1 outer membrane protein assembly factor BamD [Maritimibacter sp.]TYP83061.1 Beta-barrel assembly machine subunit BamD [Maritimibacter alkaliphilus HTCC2654]
MHEQRQGRTVARLLKGATTLALVVTLAGCSGTGLGTAFSNLFGDDRETKPIEDYTAEQIYARAEYDLENNDYDEAAKWFGEVERVYPYTQLAKRALIMQAFAHHKDGEYELARAAAQRFVDFYPGDEDAGYATYLLALSYYDQIEDVGRDQGLTYQALQALRDVIELYPDTEYARSAILKFDLAYDHLAAKEMEIGRYYLKRKHYAAAVNRFRVVVEQFQTTTQTPEALHRLVESYVSLGLSDEAETAGAILGYNYQSTEWYQDSYNLLTKNGLKPQSKGNNWLSAIYRQMVRGEWL